jgi:hypothetical protein
MTSTLLCDMGGMAPVGTRGFSSLASRASNVLVVCMKVTAWTRAPLRGLRPLEDRFPGFREPSRLTSSGAIVDGPLRGRNQAASESARQLSIEQISDAELQASGLLFIFHFPYPIHSATLCDMGGMAHPRHERLFFSRHRGPSADSLIPVPRLYSFCVRCTVRTPATRRRPRTMRLKWRTSSASTTNSMTASPTSS